MVCRSVGLFFRAALRSRHSRKKHVCAQHTLVPAASARMSADFQQRMLVPEATDQWLWIVIVGSFGAFWAAFGELLRATCARICQQAREWREFAGTLG